MDLSITHRHTPQHTFGNKRNTCQFVSECVYYLWSILCFWPRFLFSVAVVVYLPIQVECFLLHSPFTILNSDAISAHMIFNVLTSTCTIYMVLHAIIYISDISCFFGCWLLLLLSMMRYCHSYESTVRIGLFNFFSIAHWNACEVWPYYVVSFIGSWLNHNLMYE